MGGTLLLADDSITIQKVVELTFAETEHTVVTVGNGRDLLQRLPDVKPDVVLCDVVMPDMNGYDVCQSLKSDPATLHIPVILLTGTFEPFDRDRALAAGCDAIVTKPFEARELIDAVEELLRRSEAARAAAPSVAATPLQEIGVPEGVPALDFTTTGFEKMVPAPPPAPTVPEHGIDLTASELGRLAVTPPPPAPPEPQEQPAPAEEPAAPFEGVPPAAQREEAPWIGAEEEIPAPLEEETFPSAAPTPVVPAAEAVVPAQPPRPVVEAAPFGEQPIEGAPPAGAPAPQIVTTTQKLDLSAFRAVPTAPPEAPAPPTQELPAAPPPTVPAIPPAPTPQVVPAPPAAAPSALPSQLSDADVDRVARRVLELAKPLIEQIAWEVIPDMAEMLVRQRIRELETTAEEET